MTKARQFGLRLGLLCPHISAGLAAELAWLAVPRGLVTPRTSARQPRLLGSHRCEGLSLRNKWPGQQLGVGPSGDVRLFPKCEFGHKALAITPIKGLLSFSL